MAFATGMFKAVLHGSIAGTQDWSMGLWLSGEVTPASFDIMQIAGALSTDAESYVGNVKGRWSSDTQYEGLTVYYYAAGSIVSTEVGEADPSSPIVGVGSGSHLPTYVSVVHTLRTLNVGRSFRGRVYLPVTTWTLGTDGQQSSSDCTALATALRDLISAWNGLDLTPSGVNGQLCVVASFTKFLATPINRVTVDSKMDVQHRRSDKIGATATATEFV